MHPKGGKACTAEWDQISLQTAFVKIKIFDWASDDLIAIHVRPRVTHAELLERCKRV